jgi:hypothetical protein
MFTPINFLRIRRQFGDQTCSVAFRLSTKACSPIPPLSSLTARATLARPLHPAALASVPSGIVLVRVRVLPRHELVSTTRGRARDAAAVTQGGFGLLDWPIGMRNLASQRPEGRAGQINKLQKPQHSRAPTPKQTRPHETQDGKVARVRATTINNHRTPRYLLAYHPVSARLPVLRLARLPTVHHGLAPRTRLQGATARRLRSAAVGADAA